jgi:DnaJ domain
MMLIKQIMGMLLLAAAASAFSFPSFFGQKEAYEKCRKGGCTPLQVLGLPPDAKWAQIRAEYKRLALKLHSDKHTGNKQKLQVDLSALSSLQCEVACSCSSVH